MTTKGKRETDTVFIVKLVILALVVRFCLGAAYYCYFIAHLKMPIYAFDGEFYSIFGWYIALVLKGISIASIPHALIPNDYSVVGGLIATIANYEGHLPPMSGYGTGIYSYMIGVFYYVFGYAPVLLRFFMSILSILSALLAYDIAKQGFSKDVARIAFVAMLFNPSFVIYSASLQRDTLVIFLILLVVARTLALLRAHDFKERALAAVLSLSSLWLLYLLRRNAIALLAIFIAVLVFIQFAASFRRLAVISLCAFLSAGLVFGNLLESLRSKLTFMLTYHLGFSGLGGYTFKLLPERYYNYEELNAGLFQQNLSNIDIAIAFVKGMIAFFCEPSPLSMYKPNHLIALPQVFLWYCIVAFACIGLYIACKKLNAEKAALIVLMLVFTVSIGMSEANTETLLRHRDMIVPIYIIFAAYGMAEIGKKMDPTP